MGRISQTLHDRANRQIKSIEPDDDADPLNNPTSQTIYDSAGQPIAAINSRGFRSESTFDLAGRRTRHCSAVGSLQTLPQGQCNSSIYDGAGQKLSDTDALGRTITYSYDGGGRLIRTDFADGSHVRSAYYANGQLAEAVDELGRIRRHEYDSLDRLLAVIDPVGQRTEYSYDEAGNKLTQKDALGRITRWEYDLLNRNTARILPMAQRESFAYDVAGHQTARTDFMGRTTVIEYDLNGRPTRASFADGRVEQTAYDAAGNRVSATTLDGTWRWTYNVRNQVIREEQPNATLEYSFDIGGNRTEMRVRGEDGVFRRTTFAYDALDRMNAITDQRTTGSLTTTFAFDAIGNRTERNDANGAKTSYAYDSRNRLRQLTTRNAANAVLIGQVITLDTVGKRTQIEEQIDGATRTYRYSFDANDRLAAEQHLLAGITVRQANFTFDAVGNRITAVIDGAAETTSFNANDELTQQANGRVTTTFRYDANANQIERSSGNQVTQSTYAANRNLLEQRVIENGVPGGIIKLKYDPDGMRLSRSEQATPPAPATTTRYVQDRLRAHPEVVEAWKQGPTASVLAGRYVHGDELILQETDSGVNPSTNHFVHQDGIGSTRLLTNAQAIVTDVMHTDAWGSSLSRTGSTPVIHQFTGEVLDSSLGLYQNRARWYAPSQARFTQRDLYEGSAMDPASLHQFGYANGDPVNRVDPSGYAASLHELNTGLAATAILGAGTLAIGNILNTTEASNTQRSSTVWDIQFALIAKEQAHDSEKETVVAQSVAIESDDKFHAHHPIPIYLCGHFIQTYSLLTPEEHVETHRAIRSRVVAVWVANELVQMRMSGRRRFNVYNGVQSPIGRSAIVSGLRLAYVDLPFNDKRNLELKLNYEAGPYFSGVKTSLSKFCSRESTLPPWLK